MPHLRVFEDLVELVDWPRGDLDPLEPGNPLARRGLRKGRLDERPELVMVNESAVVGREGGLGREPLVAEHRAESRVLVGVHDHDLKPAVPGAERLGGSEDRVAVADARRARARVEVVGDRVGEECQCRGEEAHVEVLALSGPLPVDERGGRHAEGEETGREVGHRAAHLRRGAAGHPGERHETAHPLGDRVVARARRVRPGLAEAGH